jgi:ankyrin repeat protein
VKTVVAVQRFTGSEGGVGGRRRAAQQASYEAASAVPGHAATPFEMVGSQVLAACSNGDVEALRQAIKQVPRAVDFEDHVGRSPLSIAATLGHEEVCRVLLELGATLERPNTKDGMTPLAVCSWSGSEAGVRALASLGADLSTPLRINGEMVPPVALCPDRRMVAVFEDLNHGSAQPVLIRQKSFRRAATVIIAAERFRRGGGLEFGKLSRIDECAVEDSRSSLDWDESSRRKIQAAADADAAAADAANQDRHAAADAGDESRSAVPAASGRAVVSAKGCSANGTAAESQEEPAEVPARQQSRRRKIQNRKRGCCGSRPPD